MGPNLQSQISQVPIPAIQRKASRTTKKCEFINAPTPDPASEAYLPQRVIPARDRGKVPGS